MLQAQLIAARCNKHDSIRYFVDVPVMDKCGSASIERVEVYQPVAAHIHQLQQMNNKLLSLLKRGVE